MSGERGVEEDILPVDGDAESDTQQLDDGDVVQVAYQDGNGVEGDILAEGDGDGPTRDVGARVHQVGPVGVDLLGARIPGSEREETQRHQRGGEREGARHRRHCQRFSGRGRASLDGRLAAAPARRHCAGGMKRPR